MNSLSFLEISISYSIAKEALARFGRFKLKATPPLLSEIALALKYRPNELSQSQREQLLLMLHCLPANPQLANDIFLFLNQYPENNFHFLSTSMTLDILSNYFLNAHHIFKARPQLYGLINQRLQSIFGQTDYDQREWAINWMLCHSQLPYKLNFSLLPWLFLSKKHRKLKSQFEAICSIRK